MGNIGEILCGQYGQDELGSGLIEMLKIANKLSLKDQRYEQLLNNNGDRLKKLIRNRQKVKEMIGDVLVRVVPYSIRLMQNFAQLISTSIKLILRTDIEHSSDSFTLHDSNKPENLSYKGCIIFSNGYYYGDIQDEEANGFGTLSFIQIDSHEIVGSWLRGSLKSGKVYRFKQAKSQLNNRRIKELILELQVLNGQKQAIVKVQNKFTYKGSIKLVNSFKYADILTGQGVIKYPNGDEYHGQLVKGKYETSLGKTATYIYASSEFISFSGSYKCGLREDIGVFKLDLQGENLNLHMAFKEGVPIERALVRLEDNSQYSIHVNTQELVVQSKIQLN